MLQPADLYPLPRPEYLDTRPTAVEGASARFQRDGSQAGTAQSQVSTGTAQAVDRAQIRFVGQAPSLSTEMIDTLGRLPDDIPRHRLDPMTGEPIRRDPVTGEPLPSPPPPPPQATVVADPAVAAPPPSPPVTPTPTPTFGATDSPQTGSAPGDDTGVSAFAIAATAATAAEQRAVLQDVETQATTQAYAAEQAATTRAAVANAGAGPFASAAAAYGATGALAPGVGSVPSGGLAAPSMISGRSALSLVA